jgi:hypothetical protein
MKFHSSAVLVVLSSALLGGSAFVPSALVGQRPSLFGGGVSTTTSGYNNKYQRSHHALSMSTVEEDTKAETFQ